MTCIMHLLLHDLGCRQTICWGFEGIVADPTKLDRHAERQAFRPILGEAPGPLADQGWAAP